MMNRRRSAFTLIELLIAGSITAIIMAAVYSSFQAGLLSYRRIEAGFGPYHTARNVFNRMNNDIRNSFVYSTNGSGFTGSAQKMEFFSVLDRYDGGNEFTDVYRVKYNTTEGVLTRLIFADQFFSQGPDPAGRRADYKINSLTIKYAKKAQDQDHNIEWLDEWPEAANNEQKKGRPLAIWVNLILETEGRKLEFNKYIAVPQ